MDYTKRQTFGQEGGKEAMSWRGICRSCIPSIVFLLLSFVFSEPLVVCFYFFSNSISAMASTVGIFSGKCFVMGNKMK